MGNIFGSSLDISNFYLNTLAKRDWCIHKELGSRHENFCSLKLILTYKRNQLVLTFGKLSRIDFNKSLANLQWF